MIKIDSVNEASRLAFGHMKPGTLTNHVMTADEYRAEVAAGRLYAHTWPGGVLFLRKRETYHMLSYYVNDIGVLPGCDLPADTLAEIAYKPSGAENAARAVDFWGRVGLKHVFDRIRLTRDCHNPSLELQRNSVQPCLCEERSDEAIRQDSSFANASGLLSEACNEYSNDRHLSVCLAAQPDFDACSRLIHASFDPRTGHIPDYQELYESIKHGHILCLKNSHGEICGLLRRTMRAASVEIRQLALRRDMRGKGLARKLLAAFISIAGDKKITVWARDGYAPAVKAYESAGFAADGWRSAVLTV